MIDGHSVQCAHAHRAVDRDATLLLLPCSGRSCSSATLGLSMQDGSCDAAAHGPCSEEAAAVPRLRSNTQSIPNRSAALCKAGCCYVHA